MKLNKTLSLFLLCHLLVWSLLPAVLRANLPMDSAEALIWGMVGEWGTNKHPPLSGWLADWAWLLSGKNPYSLYVLSQILVCGGLIYIYKLAKCFLSREKAVIATVLMEGVAYYSLVTPEYNCNIVALFLWPACTYHFYQAVKYNRWYNWLLFGAFAGFNLLNKYVSGALLLSLGLYLLTSPGRKYFRSWKLYLSVFVAFIIILPHFVWLYNHDFFVIDYFLGRSSGKVLPYGLGHLIYPLKFLAAQLLTSSATVIVLYYFWRRHHTAVDNKNSSDRHFLFYAGVMPLLIMLAVPLLGGIKLKSMWGSPALYMLTIMWLVFLPFDTFKTSKQLIKSAYGLLILFALAFAGQNLLTLSPKFNLNAGHFVEDIGGNQVQYTGGNIWLASTIGAYAHSHPQVIFEMNPAINPWIDIKQAVVKGVLVVEEDINIYNAHRKNYPGLPEAEVYHLPIQNILGQNKTYQIYYGYLSGENQ